MDNLIIIQSSLTRLNGLLDGMPNGRPDFGGDSVNEVLSLLALHAKNPVLSIDDVARFAWKEFVYGPRDRKGRLKALKS